MRQDLRTSLNNVGSTFNQLHIVGVWTLMCQASSLEETWHHPYGGGSILRGDDFLAALTGRLVRIEGKMNREKYREILDENLLQSTQSLRLGRRFTYQQDNDPKHTAKTLQEWLQDKSLNVLEWPSQSPDLNLI